MASNDVNFELYILDQNDEKLDLVCHPFYIQKNEWEDTYSREFEEYQNYQFAHNYDTKQFVSQPYSLAGMDFSEEEYNIVRNYINIEDKKFRLFWRSKKYGVLLYSHITYKGFTKHPVPDSVLIDTILNLNRISHWYTDHVFESPGVGEVPDFGYAYNYESDVNSELTNDLQLPDEEFEETFPLKTMIYEQDMYDSEFLPIPIPIDLATHESMPFRLEVYGNLTDFQWNVTNMSGIVVGSGGVKGNANGFLVIDTRPLTKQITVDGIDIRGQRDYDKLNWFNLPQGGGTFWCKNTIKYRLVVYGQFTIT